MWKAGISTGMPVGGWPRKQPRGAAPRHPSDHEVARDEDDSYGATEVGEGWPDDLHPVFEAVDSRRLVRQRIVVDHVRGQ
jgi:hypothetical protein